jgi:cell division transport system ATP-binding protein
MSTPIITFENVTKAYPPDTHALRGVSFAVKPGEFVSIVGTSGSGKTTLAKLLFAEERATTGKILVGDWDITKLHGADIPTLRRQIGMVFQDYKLLPRKTAYENVAFALEVAGASGSRIKEIVPQVLTIVGLKDKMHRFPRQLSGGEQQRVSIARALVHRPKIMLADEPTGNLDAITARDIVDLLQRINEFGTTVLLVTHDKDIVNMLHRRVITLADGRIASDVAHGKYHL